MTGQRNLRWGIAPLGAALAAAWALGCNAHDPKPGAATTVEPAGPLQFAQNVGSASVAGQLRADSNSAYHLQAYGTDIWGQVDEFYFAHAPHQGDGQLTAKVQLDPGRDYAKAVLMMRASPAADAAYVDAAVHSNGLAALQYRPLAGAHTLQLHATLQAPQFVTLERNGDEFRVGFSNDSTHWEWLGPLVVHLPPAVHAGVGLSARSRQRAVEASFSEVQLTAPAAQQMPLP